MIEKTIREPEILRALCFLKLRDTILNGCFCGIFCFYDMNTEQCTITKNNHDDNINDLLMLDNNTFLSCSHYNTIKVWKY